jgi:hypothetical protein
MRTAICKTLLLLGVLFITTSFKHPLKFTALLVEYNQDKKVLQMQCKVFCDDFSLSLNKHRADDIDINKLSKNDHKIIANYLNDYVKVLINNKPIILTLKSTEVSAQENIITFKFLDNPLIFNKGDKLQISNTLFFEDFSYMQLNRLLVTIPPKFKEDYQELNMQKYGVIYIL